METEKEREREKESDKKVLLFIPFYLFCIFLMCGNAFRSICTGIGVVIVIVD